MNIPNPLEIAGAPAAPWRHYYTESEEHQKLFARISPQTASVQRLTVCLNILNFIIKKYVLNTIVCFHTILLYNA